MAGEHGLILDVDPGHDDAVAMLLALRWPGFRVLGVVATAGNQTLDRTLRNARAVVALAGSDAPVAAGRKGPLVGQLTTAPTIHGQTGLEGVTMEDLAPLYPESAQRLVSDIARSWDGPLTMVATGPLTNLAVTLAADPYIQRRLDRVVIMGGCVGGGNITPAAEFNFFVDPEAARIVLDAGMMPTVVGLNVTHRALISTREIAAIESLGSPQARAVATWLGFYGAAYSRRFGWDGIPLHDACAVLETVEPGLVKTEDMAISVETRGDLTRGALVPDLRPLVEPPAPNARVAVDILRDRFVELLMNGLKSYQ